MFKILGLKNSRILISKLNGPVIKPINSVMNWKQLLNFEPSEVIGLDIGSSAVKSVILRKGGPGYTIAGAGFAEIAADRDHKSIVRAVRECFALTRLRSKNRLKTRLAVCGLNGPEVAVRDFEFSALADEDVEGAVLLEAAQVCPFNAEQAAIDYQLVPNGNDKTQGVLVAATNMLMTNKLQRVKEAGLKCVLMDIDGLALLNCLNGLVDEQERVGTAVLNVGASCTTLAIMGEGGWPFIRDMNFAGDEILRQMTAGNDMTQTMFRAILFDDGPDSQAEVGDNLEKACSELIADVSETLRFYAAQKKSTHVKKIFVCGGFARARGFVELLGRRLGMDVRLWNPLESMQCGASDKSKNMYTTAGPAMAVAAGLAMRSIRNNVYES
jgi:type IV pilus assembly protein PilM